MLGEESRLKCKTPTGKVDPKIKQESKTAALSKTDEGDYSKSQFLFLNHNQKD